MNIQIDRSYAKGSENNRAYDLFYNFEPYDDYPWHCLAIEISGVQKPYSIGLIGSPLGSDENCAILENGCLTVLLDNSIMQINVADGNMTSHKILDIWPDTFGIYRVKRGYIIHGEMDIMMFDENFEKKWSCSGGVFLNYSQ